MKPVIVRFVVAHFGLGSKAPSTPHTVQVHVTLLASVGPMGPMDFQFDAIKKSAIFSCFDHLIFRSCFFNIQQIVTQAKQVDESSGMS